MALETGTYINSLVATNPTSGDLKSQGDDHLRLIKAAIKASFPNVAGAVTLTHGQLSGVDTPLTGTPTAPTQSPADNSTAIATTAYVDASFVAQAYPPVSGNSGKFLTNDGNITSWADAYTEAECDAKFSTIVSPTFTGVPVAPTAVPDTSTTQIATTAFVTTEANLKADLASPTLTGAPLAPTASPGTDTTQIATTAFATTADNLKENSLGNPASDGMVLSSTAAGSRSWAYIGGIPSSVSGAIISNNSSTPTTDIDVSAGWFIDSTGAMRAQVGAASARETDKNFGTDNGIMLDSTAIASDTCYLIYAMIKDSDNSVAVGALADGTAYSSASEYATYSKYCVLGCIWTDSSGNVVAMEMGEEGTVYFDPSEMTALATGLNATSWTNLDVSSQVPSCAKAWIPYAIDASTQTYDDIYFAERTGDVWAEITLATYDSGSAAANEYVGPRGNAWFINTGLIKYSVNDASTSWSVTVPILKVR